MQQDVAPSLVIERLKQAYGVDTLDKLAARIGRPDGTVKGWSARQSVPIDVLMRASVDQGVSVDWLLGLVNDPAMRENGSIHQPYLDRMADPISQAPVSKVLKQSATVAGEQVDGDRAIALALASKKLKQSATVAGRESVPAGEFQPLAFAVAEDAVPYRLTDLHKRPHRAGEPQDVPDSYTKALIAGGAPGLRALPLAGDGTPLVGGYVMAPSSTSPSVPLVIPVRFGDTPQTQTQRDFEVLPTFRASASAGPGLQNAQDAVLDQAGYVAIDRAWMRERFGRAGGGYATVEVHGDSMQPTLTNGETIVVDTTVDRVDVSGIYIVRSGLDFLVKRVQRNLDGSLVIMSDNPSYASETIPAGKTHSIEIKGRMVGAWVRR